MLVLTRRMGETLVVGDDIKITIVGVKGGQVRLGIEAPREVSIQREELLFKNNMIQQVVDASEDSVAFDKHH